MNPEDRVLRALNTLKHVDQGREAPRSIEDKLLAAFRAGPKKPGSRVPWVAAALAAAVIVTIFSARSHTVRQAPVPVAPKAAPLVAVFEKAQAAPVLSVTVPVRPVRVRSAPVAEPPREIVTDFFPLMDVAPPLGRGQLLRVALPASTMRSVGLPVRQERLDEPVQADVLIGEEGMVRAIRFVSQRN